MIRVEIQAKLPSCNNYINANRNNRYLGASMKRKTEELIYYYIKDLPVFDKPIKINFIWVEENKRRDLDNICFAKKFILDALVKAGKLKDDNRNNVYAFTDTFRYEDTTKVILEIEEGGIDAGT
jgi:Holliday junction resolvase RusA-like endonuclease